MRKSDEYLVGFKENFLVTGNLAEFKITCLPLKVAVSLLNINSTGLFVLL